MEKITATKITILLQIYRVQSVTHLYQCIILLQTSTMMKIPNEIQDSAESKQELEDSIEEYIKNKRKEFYEEFGIAIRTTSKVHKMQRHHAVPTQPISMETRTKDKEV